MKQLVLVLCAFLLSLPVFSQEPKSDGVLEERTPYTFPFETHEAWLEAMKGKGIPDWSVIVSKTEYDRYRANQKIVGERITYWSDGLRIKGFLIRPAKVEGRLPVVIYNRGGTMSFGRITFWEILEWYRLAEKGYVILASHLRGSAGSEGNYELGAGDIRDTLNLIKLAASLPEADAQRVGMWGFSRGAITTLLAMKQNPNIKAAALIGGSLDAINSHRRAEFDEHVYPHVIPNYSDDKDAAIKKISATTWAEELPPAPILLLHGTHDERVLPYGAMKMAGKLQKFKRPYRLKIYEGGSHSLLEDFIDVRAEIERWFKRYL